MYFFKSDKLTSHTVHERGKSMSHSADKAKTPVALLFILSSKTVCRLPTKQKTPTAFFYHTDKDNLPNVVKDTTSLNFFAHALKIIYKQRLASYSLILSLRFQSNNNNNNYNSSYIKSKVISSKNEVSTNVIYYHHY